MTKGILALASFCCVQCVSFASESKKLRTKVFKSELGYEITYPDCLKISADSADDLEKKVETLNSIIFYPNGCSKGIVFEGEKTFYGISKVNLINNVSIPTHIINVEQWANSAKYRGGTNFIFVHRPADDKKKVFKLVTLEHTGYLRWKFYLPCKKQLFEFEIMTKRDVKVTEDFKLRLLRNDFSDIKTELSIIESFTCK